jgi:hypothetical protein
MPRTTSTQDVACSAVAILWMLLASMPDRPILGGAHAALLRRGRSLEQERNTDGAAPLFLDRFERYGECPNAPMLHVSGQFDSQVKVENNKGGAEQHTYVGDTYKRHYQGFVNRWYPKYLKDGTLVTDTEVLFTASVANADFVFWGNQRGTFDMSLYNYTTSTADGKVLATSPPLPNGNLSTDVVIEGDNILDAFRTNWKFTDPAQRDLKQITHTTVLDAVSASSPETEYVAFLSIRFNEYQHILLDHLGYLAYLRHTQPPTTRFILVETLHSRGVQRKLLEELDPEFAARVDWITCGTGDTSTSKPYPNTAVQDTEKCNQRIQVRGGGSVKVLVPQSSTKHESLLHMARAWIYEKIPPPPPRATKAIIYYKRTSEGNASNGRLMEAPQEKQILNMLRHMITRFNRPEKLVIFDGSHPHTTFKEQVALFQSASLVIGAHGGGLANLLFSTPPPPTPTPEVDPPANQKNKDFCQQRTKVLEFTTSPLTPDFQSGTLNRSYYNLMSTGRWLDFHHVWFSSKSTRDTTLVDIPAFRHALLVLLGGVGAKKNGDTLHTIQS